MNLRVKSNSIHQIFKPSRWALVADCEQGMKKKILPKTTIWKKSLVGQPRRRYVDKGNWDSTNKKTEKYGCHDRKMKKIAEISCLTPVFSLIFTFQFLFFKGRVKLKNLNFS